MDYVLAIDQGTTSSRAILFDDKLRPVHTQQQEFTQHFPKSGWVEHDPEEIWAKTLEVAKSAVAAGTPKAIGITNQRETTVVWDRSTGQAVYNAIVWQDRRTGDYCDSIRDAWSQAVNQKTGLVVDPYFSATKVKWILDNVDGG